MPIDLLSVHDHHSHKSSMHMVILLLLSRNFLGLLLEFLDRLLGSLDLASIRLDL